MFFSLRILHLIAFLAGASLPLAFAPHHFWFLAIVSPALLLWVWQNYYLTPGKLFSTGFIYGIGMFGVGVSWVFVSIHDYGNTNIPLAVGITSLLIILLALFIGLQGYLLKYLFKGSLRAFYLMGFPSIWVLLEWLRGWLFTGFPWLYLGYTQINTPLAGYAPILSVYGVSFAVALSSGILIALIRETTKIKCLMVFMLALLWCSGFYLKTFNYAVPLPKTYAASLIQGNIKPFDKFTQQKPILSVEKTYGILTQATWGSDLILWPEGAIPLPLPYSETFVNQLSTVATIHGSTLITGVLTVNQKGQYFNSLIALGNGHGTYHKQHLLPFGDFVPFENILRGTIDFFNLPMSSFIEGPSQQSLISAGDLLLNPLICYEIVFPTLVRNTLRNANVIINLSEDGWFGNSWGPHQHLQIAQMRALETERYVLRATTSGISAIINTKGALVQIAPQFEAIALKGSFQAMTGNTPWVKIGPWPFLCFLIACFTLPRLAMKKKD